MILQQSQISEIKKDLKVIDLKTDKEKLHDRFFLANRTSYETGLLFLKAYEILGTFDYPALNESIKKARSIGEDMDFFNHVMKYPDQVIKTCSDCVMQSVISRNRDFVYEFIDLFWGKLIETEKSETSDFLEVAKKLREK